MAITQEKMLSITSSQRKGNQMYTGYHLTLTRTAILKTEINPAEGVERREPSYSVAAAAAKSLQSCPTLCTPRDGSPPGSPVPGILQARTLEWAAISFSNAGK